MTIQKPKNIKTIVFDLGAVLIDWNPRYLYRKVFEDEEKMEAFLSTICTPDWNEQQDAGRPIEEANQILIGQFPEHKEMIELFYGRWTEMLNGAIQGTVDILKEIHATKKYQLLVLSNWSAETFPHALERFDFLNLFDGKIISGEHDLKKPDPKIYQLLEDQFDMQFATSIFIDDSQRNVDGGNALGLYSILFENPDQLRDDLEELNIL
ncbi:MAG: HAD family phosphatase [Bacteroidota bacterium]